jgi:hypothetical protein
LRQFIEKVSMPGTSRRVFIKHSALATAAFAFGGAWKFVLPQNDGPLIDALAAACRRLAPLGWRQLLLDVTDGQLDIAAADLGAQLARPLPRIDRNHPGFGDFALTGTRGVEPGQPDRSLLYHAFASPTVVARRTGAALAGYPTLAEIDAAENYVYGVQPPTLDDLRRRAGGAPLGIVVYALQYRNTPDSVHGRHAELCFARTGIARLGTIEPLYDARTRRFALLDPARPFEFRVVPQRFAAYLAVQRKGDPASFGPQDTLDGDRDLDFWVPVHKLFNGRECIAGLDLALELHREVQNDELATFHRYLDQNGYQNNWRGEHLEQFPFEIRNERIASMSARPELGPGVLEPRPAPLAEAAEYQGQPLTFPVDHAIMGDLGRENWAFSSMQIIPGPATETPSYMYDSSQDTQRPAPEYLNVRHRVTGPGQVENLNLRPDMDSVIAAGGYQAQHYIDFTGDGWVEARCDALAPHVGVSQPAYCVVAPPDFYPRVSQRDLMNWWKRDVPQPVRDALWAIPPLTLSQTRIAANIQLPINFSVDDTTVTALVTQPTRADGPVQQPNGPVPQEQTGLPDTSPGLFDPGWDTSQGIYFTDPGEPLQKFLTGHALGAPFIEDAKLCAAYGAYWPGVSPDATRAFQPNKLLSGISYPWPTIVPMTDEEIGITPAADGTFMPWDGVRGPTLKTVAGRTMVAYRDAMRVDYLDLPGTMTAALTARVDLEEYTARVMAMSAVYWALGIHDPEIMRGAKDHESGMIAIIAAKSAWAVRSFQAVDRQPPELAEALAAARQSGQAPAARFAGPRRYRFEVYRWGGQVPDPDDLGTVLVEMLESAVAYVDGSVVLIRRNNGPWTLDTSIPTS